MMERINVSEVLGAWIQNATISQDFHIVEGTFEENKGSKTVNNWSIEP